MSNSLQEAFGFIDIYLFDQLLKGRFDESKTILDAGCGGGRNMVYFLRNGFEVSGVDERPDNIATIKQLSKEIAPKNPAGNFHVAAIENMPFDDGAFDIVVCSAVLHFAKNREHFERMLHSLWRVLKPGGYLFARLASNIGIKSLVNHKGNGRYLLPDGTERYLVDEQALLLYTQELKGTLYEPIKTTNVQNLRCMTTWCLQK